MKTKCAAVVLAAGQGKRMNSSVPKQYLCIKDKPVLYYSLKVFQESFIDEIVLVTAESDIEYCKKEIVEKYGFHKVSHITAGGRERYHSVFSGIEAAGECSYIFIHDGARPFVTEEILERAYASVSEYDACVIGMPSKDTVKLADKNGFASTTPKRDFVWTVQTPQVFSASLIKEAYGILIRDEKRLLAEGMNITDDAMVVETFTDTKVKLVKGSYENIKITTPEDLKIAEAFLDKAGK
ncbi:2-C-methyl-D-erythritol 4-phosphate cytidylyltransferase [Kineothrix alysoides]|uniref:2-C-methyl-D-erythritol 4-phosphate cytidylyltransferase n=1 Tax=Kineothrix alysoides TaxID=1469948 RepID=A0A4R1QWS0_9FIRM|nr:2-C-methyl-D-erythritol 4-phosphate cytidylyltransferase [Kineothrix alysoides]TCL57891.1 2-C-methyl-D-erythritol 4-phosphate cytidylyltransferase [Kineothrix alysoides]